MTDLLLDIAKVKSEQSDLSINLVHEINKPYEVATFGMGCYWSAEAIFGATKGILRTRVGYSGGKSEFAHNNIGDHTEVVEIHYDPESISFREILKIFWENHVYSVELKRKYMSLILINTDEQKQIAQLSKNEKQTENESEKVHTEISEATEFHPSEDIHQKHYLQQHPDLFLTLDLNSELLQKSHVAAKLNGHVVGLGDLVQFTSNDLGLTPTQIEYVSFYMKKFEGGALECA